MVQYRAFRPGPRNGPGAVLKMFLPLFELKEVPKWGEELIMKATVFAKLLTLNMREEFKWFLRYQPWYRDVENLKRLSNPRLTGRYSEEKNCNLCKTQSFFKTCYLMR